MSKQPPPAPTASAIDPCPTIQNVGRPGTGSLPRTIAPPDHPHQTSYDSGIVRQDYEIIRDWPIRSQSVQYIDRNGPKRAGLITA